MKYLIWANFKMYKNQSELKTYFDTFVQNYHCFTNIDLTIAPMTVCLSTASELTKNSCIHLGAQNMYYEDQWAYTGETSPVTLKELGCEYVIIGHSERRKLFAEEDSTINKKLQSAIKHGIRPILCVGESSEEKDLWLSKENITIQLRKALKGIDSNLVDIAYEPIWAIGTGQTPTPEEINEMHHHIRQTINNNESRIIYGGSVNDTNAESIITQAEVNGFLIGGASLDAQKFLTIINIVANQQK